MNSKNNVKYVFQSLTVTVEEVLNSQLKPNNKSSKIFIAYSINERMTSEIIAGMLLIIRNGCYSTSWLRILKYERLARYLDIISGDKPFSITCPTSISETNFLAVAPFLVKMAVPLPYGFLNSCSHVNDKFQSYGSF